MDENESPKIKYDISIVGQQYPARQLHNVTIALEKSLRLFLKEMDAIQSLAIGSEAWIQNVQHQVKHLEDLTTIFQNDSSTSTPQTWIIFNMWTAQITTVLKAAFYNLNPTIGMNDLAKSRIRKVHRAAAICLRTFVQTITSNQPAGRFPHVKTCIVALLKGLSSEVAEPQNQTTTRLLQPLENPTSTWLEIMMAIQVLLKVYRDEDELETLPTCNDLTVRIVGYATDMMIWTQNSSSSSSKSNNFNNALRIESAAVLAKCMETISTEIGLWRALFPGILTALYRCLLSCHRQVSRGQSVVLECSCLFCIRQLIMITLRPMQVERTQASQDTLSSTAAMLQKLKLTVASDPKSVEQVVSESPSSDFLSNVHKKAVPPLLILLKQSMTSNAPKVKMEVIQLAHTVLIDTNLCWTGSSLLEAALEACLILQNDASTEENISSAATSVLESYHVNVQDRSTILSKIRTLVQELPSLVEGGKSVDCKMHLQLVKGYIQALGTAAGPCGSTGKGLKASTFPYQSFIQLIDVDFSVSSRPSRFLVEIGSPTTTPRSRLPIKTLSSEHAVLVQQVLIAFGEVLGPKQGAFLVDSVLSDIFGAWHRESLSLSILKQWAARLVVASQILFGSFSCKGVTGVTPSKDGRRRKTILNTLAASVLPLLMDPPLHMWNLGTVLVQEGIASVMILSLEFASTMVNLMIDHGADDSESLIQALLYPLLSKVHGGNGTMIREAAKEVMDSLAVCRGLQNRSRLIIDRCGMLLAEMLSQLRIPGGGRWNGRDDSEEIIQVAFALTWVLDECTIDRSELHDGEPTSTGSTLVELVGTLMDRIDHQFISRSMPEKVAFQLTRMYAAVFKYLKMLHFAVDDQKASVTGEGPAYSWLKLLSLLERSPNEEFRASSAFDSDGDEGNSGREGVQRGIFGKLTVDLIADVMFRLCFLLSNDSLRVRIGACESMTHGFEYLAKVTTQLQGNEAEDAAIRNALYRQVATSWPSIKARLSTLTDNVVEKHRPISSLLIVTATIPGRNSERTHGESSVGGSQRTLTDDGPIRFFLSRLYLLIASMFECSGDFMADRFGSSVWPIMAQQFEQLIRVNGISHPYPRHTESRVKKVGYVPNILETAVNDKRVEVSHRTWLDSERNLALAMLECLRRVFSCEASQRTVLVRIHQAVGLVLLPFLEGDHDDVSNHDISDAAMHAIKAIVSQDSDVLLRPLLELSGTGIPHCPIRPASAQGETGGACEAVTNQSNLARRCQELLEFIESLPEQELT